MPATSIEQMVLAQVHAALMAPEVVQSVWDVVRSQHPYITEPEIVLPLRRIGQVWEQLFPAERQRIVRLLIDRVVVAEAGIEIIWREMAWYTLIIAHGMGSAAGAVKRFR